MGVASEQCPQERFPTSRPCLQSVSWGVRGQLLRPIIVASCGLRPGVSTTKRPTLLLTRSTSCKTDLYSQLEKSMGIGSLWVIDQPASSESIVHWLKSQLTARWRRFEADDTGDPRSDGRINTSSAFKTLNYDTNQGFDHWAQYPFHPSPCWKENAYYYRSMYFLSRFPGFPFACLWWQYIKSRSTLAKPPTSSSKRGRFPLKAARRSSPITEIKLENVCDQ